ncbi:hypothetical protein [Clostridium perfringens]|uniref:hypothetical protein n=1 Tax=Clostridium perfringens TaxID=1502 RepID=UPI002FCD29DA
MIEQKLFFTRNNIYSFWEKLSSLNEEDINLIIAGLEDEDNIQREREDISCKKSYIYNKYNENDELKSLLEDNVNSLFNEAKVEKLDFNANLYKINLGYTNFELAKEKLERLKNLNSKYELDITTYIFSREIERCIDIRISSLKRSEYKDNLNEQTINTEVRIYFKLGLLVITDYNEYTHTKKVKDILLENIYSLLGDNYNGKDMYKLSDITLRMLLKKSDKYASKFKFIVDEYVNVDFSISDIGDNPLEHEALREFYDKHKISLIKICMSSDLDKYITIDGIRGKIMSRSKTILVKDIDEFIGLLDEVIKYDYLNFDYKKDIKNKAMIKLTMHRATKVQYVNEVYAIVEREIKKYLGEKDSIEIREFTKNTLFYCLLKNKISIDEDVLEYTLEKGAVSKLSKWLEIDGEVINKTFNRLIKIARENENNLLEMFDSYINSVGELNASQL